MKNSISAKSDTLQVYSFSGVGSVSDKLRIKPKKNDKGVGNYPLLFLVKTHQKSKLESAYTNKSNVEVSGTKHTKTTPNGRVIHGKWIDKPVTDFIQNCNNTRGTGPRRPDVPFTRPPSKQKKVYIIESDNEPETPPPERSSPRTPDQMDDTAAKKRQSDRG